MAEAGMSAAIAKDRLAYPSEFLSAFFNSDVLLGKRVSKEVVQDSWNLAAGASPIGTWWCPPMWHTDVRDELNGERTHKAIEGSTYITVPDALHGLLWAHAEVNRGLVEFLAAHPKVAKGKSRQTVTA